MTRFWSMLLVAVIGLAFATPAGIAEKTNEPAKN